jgi:hypothetical protein
MQRNFYKDDFEQLMRQKADQYKMYPSDHVWKGVHKALHGRKRWYWTGMAVILLGLSVFTTDYLLNQQARKHLAQKMQPSLTALQESNLTGQINSASANQKNELPSNSVPERIIRNPNTLVSSLPIEKGLIVFNLTPEETEAPFISESFADHKKVADHLTFSQPGITDNTLSIFADAASESSKKPEQQVNWLQEFAVYRLTPTRQQRLGWMLYFSPTMNYRKLNGNALGYAPASEIQSVPLALNFNGDVDKYVHHKPALGFELGSNIFYRSSKHVYFKAGIQFNYSRYNIEAFSSHPEKATIALNPYWNADTMVSYTSVRNMSGNAQQELANQYFQLSIPVGVEIRLFGNEKLQLDVAGSVQPTYLLNRNSYLITTDYKNYTREPSLVRRWNINAGLETYVAYNTGTVRWQLGPQFRYQLLSSYVNKYPIKEYLMEYGFKIGVSKTIR